VEKNYYFAWLILAYVFSSCDYIPGGFAGDTKSIEIGDTIRIIKYEKRPTYIRDTIYIDRVKSDMADVYIDTLKRYLGTRELTGNNDGVNVEKFTRVACNMGKVAYCAGYLAYGLKVNGISIPDCACWSPCMVPDNKIVWRRGDSHQLNKGEIFGLYFQSKKRVAHVGAVIEDFGDGWILTIEGNTDDAGSREGNGVFTRLRHKSQLYVAAKWI